MARPGLSADAMVAAAIALARTEGLAGLSMRRLAEELGIAPMSLYRHLADRQDLLLRMLDVVADSVAGRVGVTGVQGVPRERITAIMHAMRAAFRLDPWVVQLLATEGLASPRILPVVDGLFKALTDAGLAPVQAQAGYALLFQFTYGEAITTHHYRPDSYERRMLRDADPGRYPDLRAVIDCGGAERDHWPENLERLLDGLLGDA